MPRKVIIHVNRAFIAANAKDNGNRPVYTAKDNGQIIYAQSVEIEGKVRLIDPRSTPQLSCGARAYLECEGEVRYIEPCSFAEAKSVPSAA